MFILLLVGNAYQILLMLEQVMNGGRTKHIMGKHASIWGLFKF
jgi:hypothetical protein